MPTVPQAGAAPDVEPSELQGPSVNRLLYRTVGAGGEGLEQLGGTLQGLSEAAGRDVLEAQATANEAAVKDNDAHLISAHTDLLHNPDTGYLNTLGKNAIDRRQAAIDAVQKSADSISESITDPRQQAMFKQVAQGRVNAAILQIDEHAAQQTQKYELDSSAARYDAAANAAIASYNPMPGANNAFFTQNLATMQAELGNQADKLGMDGDQRQQFINKSLANTYGGLIDHLLSNNQTQAAKDVFTKTEDTFNANPELADRVRATLKAAGTKDDALGLAIQVKGQTGDIGAQEKILDQKFTSGQITSDVHDMALAHLRADNAQRRSEEGEADKSVLGQVWAMKQQNPNSSIADLSPHQLAYIERRGLGQHVDAIFSQRNDMDDSQTYVDLMRMSVDDPAGFGGMNLAQLSGSLTGAHWNRLVEAQTAINKSNTAQTQATRTATQAAADAVASLSAAGFPVTAKGEATAKATDEQKQQLALFQQDLIDQVHDENDRRVAAQKAPVSRDEARTMAQGLLKQQSLAGTGLWGMFQTHAPTFELMGDIPNQDQQRIGNALRRGGLPSTPANVVDYYNRERNAVQ